MYLRSRRLRSLLRILWRINIIATVQLFKRKRDKFFTEAQEQAIVQGIRDAERMSSGEIRVYIESRCSYVDPLDRAKEIFEKLQMFRTKQRNGVLLYLAMKDRQFAIFGDQGIHQKVGDDFWEKQKLELKRAFRSQNFVKGIVECLSGIGASLQSYFPYQSDDEDELPDDIVFGR